MLLTAPPTLQFKSLFLNGTTPFNPTTSRATSLPHAPPPSMVNIKAMRTLQGRVICNTNDKTVAVEVVRLAPHPKYKRRVRIKKKYQAHDPLNQFQVGDIVQLEKGRPISKTKTYWAVPAPSRAGPRVKAEDKAQELGIPLESQS